MSASASTADRKRADFLRNEINKHDYQYHVLDRPLITDQEYDRMFAELREIEEKNPSLITGDSPTQRVSGTPLEVFQKVAHRKPMLSLANSYSPEDILAFDERIKKVLSSDASVEYFCEPKFDGLAVELIYEQGLLVGAVTRGD